jgi:small subunit ribosomal protein S7
LACKAEGKERIDNYAEKTRSTKRETIPDPVPSKAAAKFINNLMWDGKKSTAQKHLVPRHGQWSTSAPARIPCGSLKRPWAMCAPRWRSKAAGWVATYQVPVEIRPERRQALAMRWLIAFARSRGEKTMAERLPAELLEASQGRGSSVKKKEDTHRMAEANKAFAHYSW